MSEFGDGQLSAGTHQLGAPRTIDLETLLATSAVVGSLASVVRSLPIEIVKVLGGALDAGGFHAADLESVLDRDAASESELREDLNGRLDALRHRLRAVNNQKE